MSAAYPDLPIHIDSTMLTCFRSCPQKFFLEFVHGYRPKGGPSIDLHAGGCFAAAIEEVYKQVHVHKKPLNVALDIASLKFDEMWGDFEIPEYKKTSKTFDRVWTAIAGGTTVDDEGYFQRYSPLTDHVQPYFKADGTPTFEMTFGIPLEPILDPTKDPTLTNPFDTAPYFPCHPSGSPFLYTGRLDMMGTYLGRPVWRDEKTSKNNPNTNRNWSEQWDLRNQFIGYTWACQQMGLDLDTGIVRGIGILKEKVGHAEAIKTYSKTVIDRWYEQLRRDLWRIRRAYDEQYFDYNFADACTAYGNCMFMRVCQSTTPESWLNEFEIRKWNPLNKELPTLGLHRCNPKGLLTMKYNPVKVILTTTFEVPAPTNDELIELAMDAGIEGDDPTDDELAEAYENWKNKIEEDYAEGDDVPLTARHDIEIEEISK